MDEDRGDAEAKEEVPMSETEKITINLGPVDLGRIDLLVEQGLYSNRTDLIRTAIRNLLDRHDAVVQDYVLKRSFTLGSERITRSALERLQAEGRRLRLRVVGSLSLADDIDPALALTTIESIVVHGSLHAPAALRSALADRINKP